MAENNSSFKALFARLIIRQQVAKDLSKIKWDNLSPSMVDLTAGLYTALILKSLGIPYEILEASERVGGRLRTHYFDLKDRKEAQRTHDYYDIGAMRFPETDIMKRC